MRGLAEAIRSRKVTSEEAVCAVFQSMEEREPSLHAFLSLWKEKTIEEARRCDALVREFVENGKEDELPPLLGVPVAVKDNLLLEGERTTCGSKMLEDFVAPYTASCVEKLKGAGAIILGKTNMDEFGMGTTTENSFFGPTKHPSDPKRVPGGSSGGSAAAVAGGMAFAALGTDTGGSVRQPAGYCGIVGLRPTYGTVSRHGLVAFASSMDIAGPLCRDVLDAALLYNVIRGEDTKDQTSVPSSAVDSEALENYTLSGKRIGILRPLLENENTEEDVAQAIQAVSALATEKGATVEMVDMPLLEHAVAVYYILSSAEASSNLSRYDGIRYGYRAEGIRNLEELYTKTRSEGFGLEVKRRILMGNYVLSSEHFEDCYRQAERAAKALRAEFRKLFGKYDLLSGPVSSTTAPRCGEAGKDPLSAYISDLCTVPASLAGIPAVSIPCGYDRDRLPIGLQLMGPCFGEQEILGAARFLEKEFSLRTGKGAGSHG